MAWHILRKDWKLLRWLVVAVAAMQLMLAAARWRLGHFLEVRQLAILGGPAGSLVAFLVIIFVIAVAVHQDALPGFRQDWLVRPVKRTDLLWAKLLFVLVLIHGPMLAIDVLLGLTAGFTIAQTLAAAVWRSLYILFAFSVPMLALAALTRNLTEVIIAFVAGLLVAVVFLMVPAMAGWTSPIDGTGVAWVPALARQAIVFAGALAVLGMQYIGRKTIPARVLFAGVVVTAQLTQFVPWSTAFALEQSVSPGPAATDAFSLAFEPGLGRFRLAPGQNVDDVDEKPGLGPVDAAAESQKRRAEGAVTVFLPLRFTGLAPEWLFMADHSEIRMFGTDGANIYRGAGNELQVRATAAHAQDVSSHHGWRVPRAIYDRVKDQPVRLEIEYSLTLFRLEAEHEIPARDGDQRMPGIGWCVTRVDPSGIAVQFRCVQAGDRPPCMTAVLKHVPTGQQNPDVSMCAPDYTPFPGHAIPDALSRFGGNLPFSDRSGLARYPVNSGRLAESQVIVKMYQPSVHLTRPLEVPAVRLADWLPEAPLTAHR